MMNFILYKSNKHIYEQKLTFIITIIIIIHYVAIKNKTTSFGFSYNILC